MSVRGPFLFLYLVVHSLTLLLLLTATLAEKVSDPEGVYFVPAFSGLFAPYWRPDARGVLVGLTQDTEATHICRAVLEAVCYQVKDVLDAMDKDTGKKTKRMKVDGGLTKSDLLMQMQADLLDIKLENPTMKEATARGAMILAGLAVGVWKSPAEVKFEEEMKSYQSTITSEDRTRRYAGWNRALSRSFNLAGDPTKQEATPRDDGVDPLDTFKIIPLLAGAMVFSTFSYLVFRRL